MDGICDEIIVGIVSKQRLFVLTLGFIVRIGFGVGDGIMCMERLL